MERYKDIFFQTRLLVALVIVFFAFEWKMYNSIYTSGLDEPLPPNIIPETVITIQKEKEKSLHRQNLDIREDDVECENVEVNADKGEAIKIEYTDIEVFKVDIDDNDSIVLIPGIMPEFLGGEEALFTYLASNINYPRAVKEINLQGTVFVQFIVEKDSSVSNVIVLRRIGGECDEEAVRVVKNMQGSLRICNTVVLYRCL